MCFMIIAYIFFILFTRNECKIYRNHALLRGTPYNFDDLAFFKRMDQVYNVTFWKKPTLVYNTVEFSIGPEHLGKLYRDIEGTPIRFITLMKDIQSAFDREIIRPYIRRNTHTFNWHSYYRLDDIYDWLRDLEHKHPDEVRVRNIGRSYEKRQILSVKLTLKGSVRRSKVIVEGGCHGNEWISPAFVTYMIHTLLHAKEYANEELERIALMYSWIFVPVMNPDGYEYAHMIDRLWRKNRHNVDLNRNYGIAFGAHCPDIGNTKNREYCGKRAFSEPESYAMSLFTKENSDNLEYYISFHSYGQKIILPYSYTMDYKENYNIVKQICEEGAKRISEKHGIKYTIGNHYDLSGSFESGTSSDWVKRALKVSYVVTFELPDRGLHGFTLPPEQILPICQATMDGLLVFLDPQTEEFVRMRSGVPQKSRVYVGIVLCNMFLYTFNRLQ